MTNQKLIETFLPDGRKVVNLYSLVLGGAPLESFVGKTCHIPGFQVGTPPGSVGVAWTVGQIRDLEIKTLGKPFDDKYNPADALPPTARGEGGFGSTGTGTGPAPGSDDDRAMEADVSEGYAAGRIEERAAVVAYLRNLTSDWSGEQLADAIERGEHRAGGER